MIKASNTAEVAKQLKEFAEENRRRLKQMVELFTVEAVRLAVSRTPLGDAEEFAAQYKRREKSLGLKSEEGVAQGAWVVSLDGNLYFVANYGRDSGAEAMIAAQDEINQYRLGESFKIGNAAPYIRSLENNWSPQTDDKGILKPTIDDIMNISAIDLKEMYDAE